MATENNVGWFGPTDGTIGRYKSATELAAEAEFWSKRSEGYAGAVTLMAQQVSEDAAAVDAAYDNIINMNYDMTAIHQAAAQTAADSASASQSASSAATSATQASGFKDTAASSASNAQTAAANAQSSNALANQAANAASQSQTVAGQYATAASASATTASNAATTASTQANNAKNEADRAKTYADQLEANNELSTAINSIAPDKTVDWKKLPTIAGQTLSDALSAQGQGGVQINSNITCDDGTNDTLDDEKFLGKNFMVAKGKQTVAGVTDNHAPLNMEYDNALVVDNYGIWKPDPAGPEKKTRLQTVVDKNSVWVRGYHAQDDTWTVWKRVNSQFFYDVTNMDLDTITNDGDYHFSVATNGPAIDPIESSDMYFLRVISSLNEIQIAQIINSPKTNSVFTRYRVNSVWSRWWNSSATLDVDTAPSGFDFNTTTNPGYWGVDVATATNAPVGVGGKVILTVIGTADGSTFQTVNDPTDGTIMTRYKETTGSWSVWEGLVKKGASAFKIEQDGSSVIIKPVSAGSTSVIEFQDELGSVLGFVGRDTANSKDISIGNSVNQTYNRMTFGSNGNNVVHGDTTFGGVVTLSDQTTARGTNLNVRQGKISNVSNITASGNFGGMLNLSGAVDITSDSPAILTLDNNSGVQASYISGKSAGAESWRAGRVSNSSNNFSVSNLTGSNSITLSDSGDIQYNSKSTSSHRFYQPVVLKPGISTNLDVNGGIIANAYAFAASNGARGILQITGQLQINQTASGEQIRLNGDLNRVNVIRAVSGGSNDWYLGRGQENNTTTEFRSNTNGSVISLNNTGGISLTSSGGTSGSRLGLGSDGVTTVTAPTSMSITTPTLLASNNFGATNINAQTLSINNAIEFGLNGSPNNPNFDFHSSGLNDDFDVRIQASGGTTSVGRGRLQITATSVGVVGGDLIADGMVYIGASSGTNSAARIGTDGNIRGSAYESIFPGNGNTVAIFNSIIGRVAATESAISGKADSSAVSAKADKTYVDTKIAEHIPSQKLRSIWTWAAGSFPNNLDATTGEPKVADATHVVVPNHAWGDNESITFGESLFGKCLYTVHSDSTANGSTTSYVRCWNTHIPNLSTVTTTGADNKVPNRVVLFEVNIGGGWLRFRISADGKTLAMNGGSGLQSIREVYVADYPA